MEHCFSETGRSGDREVEMLLHHLLCLLLVSPRPSSASDPVCMNN